MAKKTSKPFVIATEGPTIDGRNITREQIIQMAASYDTKVYTAGVNIEHLLSLDPAGMFSAQGAVIKLGTQEATLMGEKKLQLTAVVEVDEALAALQDKGKKAFHSMEIQPNFLGKGFTYLTGLACTDRPASIGTESMKFSADKQCVYAFGGDGVAIEFEDQAPASKEGEGLFAKVMAKLTGKDKKDEDRFADTSQAVELIAGSQRDLLDKFAALQDELKAANEQIKAATDAATADRDAFAKLKATLDSEEANPKRPPAAGGNGGQLAEF